MPDIDFALAWTFVFPEDGKPRQLRFRQNFAPTGDDRVFDGTGQLYAVIADASRADNGHEIAISRPNVPFDAIEITLDGWQQWAVLYVDDNQIDHWINLALIRDAINMAQLGLD